MAALALPALAGAGASLPDNQYEGLAERDPIAYVGFNVKGKGEKRRIAGVTTTLKYACRGLSGGGVGPMRSNKTIEVKPSGRFSGKVPATSFAVPGRADLRVTGKLRANGQARGTIRSTLWPMGAPRRARGISPSCYTGQLKWRAKKGAEVPVPIPRPASKLEG